MDISRYFYDAPVHYGDYGIVLDTPPDEYGENAVILIGIPVKSVSIAIHDQWIDAQRLDVDLSWGQVALPPAGIDEGSIKADGGLQIVFDSDDETAIFDALAVSEVLDRHFERTGQGVWKSSELIADLVGPVMGYPVTLTLSSAQKAFSVN